MSSDIPLVIRCAHQAFADERRSCPADWSVYRLKEMLRDSYDNKPDPLRQRLIHCGQLLKDDALLGDCLKNYTDDPNHEAVIHLVYTPNIDELKQRQKSSSPDLSSVNAQPAPIEQSQEVTVDRAATSDVSATFAQQFLYPGNADNMFSQHMVQAQNAYAFYLHNYLAYIQQMYGVAYPTAALPTLTGFGMAPQFQGLFPTPGDSGSLPGLIPAEAGSAENNGTTNADDGAAPVPAEQRRNDEQQMMNAQGGIDDDELGDRDWLDMVYMGLRGFLLIVILYHYSNLTRMTFVVFIISLLYGYQQGWFGRNVDRNRNNVVGQPGGEDARNNEEAPQEENQRVPGNDDNNNNVAQDEAALPAEAVPQEPDRTHQPQDGGPGDNNQFAGMTPWQIFWTVTYTFFTTFFASLIPERPPPLELN